MFTLLADWAAQLAVGLPLCVCGSVSFCLCVGVVPLPRLRGEELSPAGGDQTTSDGTESSSEAGRAQQRPDNERRLSETGERV